MPRVLVLLAGNGWSKSHTPAVSDWYACTATSIRDVLSWAASLTMPSPSLSSPALAASPSAFAVRSASATPFAAASSTLVDRPPLLRMSPKLDEVAPALVDAPAVEPNGFALAKAENAFELPDEATEPKPDDVKLANVGCLGFARGAASALAALEDEASDVELPVVDGTADGGDRGAAGAAGGGGDLDSRSFEEPAEAEGCSGRARDMDQRVSLESGADACEL